ncbi:hypothetical protein ACFLQN_03850 [Candidatus Aenigmatarchaeota archaeon]
MVKIPIPIKLSKKRLIPIIIIVVIVVVLVFTPISPFGQFTVYSDEEVDEGELEYYEIFENDTYPNLSFEPKKKAFGEIIAGENLTTDFEIWNSGTGILTYTVIPNCTWVDVYPTAGTSTGERDKIKASIFTENFTPGSYECNIKILSNGGRGIFEVSFAIIKENLTHMECVDKQCVSVEGEGEDQCETQLDCIFEPAVKETNNQTNETIDVPPIITEVYNDPTDDITERMDFMIYSSAVDDIDLETIKIYVDGNVKNLCLFQGAGQTGAYCKYISRYITGDHSYYVEVTDSNDQVTQSEEATFSVTR